VIQALFSPTLSVIHLLHQEKASAESLQNTTLDHGRTIFGRRAFTVVGPTAWNSLPDYLRDPSLSEDTFRRLSKTYLFALY